MNKKQKDELKPSVTNNRKLTVSYLHRQTKIPFIRLCGKWLKDAGFFPSSQISVTVEMQKLVIEMAKEN